jgi:hypothetical protein
MEDERRKKVLADYRKRLLDSREYEAKVKDCTFGTRKLILESRLHPPNSPIN